MKRLVAIVAVLSLVLVTVVAVGLAVWQLADSSAEDGPSGRSASAPPQPGSTEAPTAELASFYGQRVDWESCQGDFECATLEVPLSYSEPAGTTIDLALLKVPAAGDRHGSMVVNPGGPGAPGTTYAAAADRVFREPLLRAFDIVGFDPRGTGDSAPIDCLADDRLDAYLAGDPTPDTPTEEEEYAARSREFAAGCAQLSGETLNHVSTIETARDLDVLRAALGEAKLTYLGASYGTKLGATYAELFPTKVGRLVLDGALDVSLDNRQLSLDQAAGFQTAMEAYLQNCIDTTETCFLGESLDDALATVSDLLDDIDTSPLPTGGARDLEIGNAYLGVLMPLYDRSYWFLLSAALREALGGQGKALLMLADLYASRGADGFTDNILEANVAINCLDDRSGVGFGRVEAEIGAFEEASPTFGRSFAWSLTGCRAAKGRTSEKPITIRGEGAAPILVVGTTRDPATPMKWAEALADQLESGVLLRRDGDGHTAYNAGNKCIDSAIEAYLLEGVVPANPTDC